VAKFITPLILKQLDRKRWQLEASLMYATDVIDRVLVVPTGFITDLASVPRLPLTFLLAGGKAPGPAVVHDWLYSTHEVDRKTADDIFYEAILAAGHSKATAWIMWLGVRAGGGFAWDKPNLPQPKHIELPVLPEAA
jgi:hypothetical protein